MHQIQMFNPALPNHYEPQVSEDFMAELLEHPGQQLLPAAQ